MQVKSFYFFGSTRYEYFHVISFLKSPTSIMPYDLLVILVNNSNFWNLILGCLMWIVWLEPNHSSFENMEKTLDELKVLCQRSLFEWARCWGFIDSSSLSEFMFSLKIIFLISLSFVLLFVSSVSCCSSSWTTCTFHFFSLITVLWLPIRKNI